MGDKRVVSIRLYRYNIGQMKTGNDDKYAVLDYFDTFSVEQETDIISGCIGKKTDKKQDEKSNDEQNHLALQEMCFESEEEFRGPDKEKMFLTLIQVFVNTDYVWTSLKEVQDLLWKYTENIYGKLCENSERKVDFQIFQLITAGDFLVSVTSNDIHAAYDISTMLRDIWIEVGDERKQLFTTYSIVGMPFELNEISEKEDTIIYDKRDLVSIRCIYSDEYRQKEVAASVWTMSQNDEYQLYGRYDYTVDIPLEDFLLIRNCVIKYKTRKGELVEFQESYNKLKERLEDDVTGQFMNLIAENAFVYWNERILLYKRDELANYRGKQEFHIKQSGKTEPLKLRNKKHYKKCCDLLKKIKQNQTIKERDRVNPYYELLERLLEISKNLNYQRELRTHVAILLKQLEYLLESIEVFKGKAAENAAKYELLESNVIIGVQSLDTFARYIRNINLQTLQAPNYNLQINGSIEKILMAYDWFIGFVLGLSVARGGKTPYYVSRDLCPVLIPQIGVRDQSVQVLFECSSRAQEADFQKNLMTVFVPNVDCMRDYASYLPILCHEIAHHIRYRKSQKERNKLLASYVLNHFSYNMFEHIFSRECVELLRLEERKKIQAIISKNMENSLYGSDEKEYAGNLRTFEIDLKDKLWSFLENGNRDIDAILGIKEYLKQTQENVMEFSEEYVEVLKAMDMACEDIETYLKQVVDKVESNGHGEVINSDKSRIQNDLRKLRIQCKKYMCDVVNAHIKEMGEKTEIKESMSNQEIKESLQKIFNVAEKKYELREHAKAVHNCYWWYGETVRKLMMATPDMLLEECYYGSQKADMAKSLFGALNEIQMTEEDKLEWRQGNKHRQLLENKKRNIGLEEENEKNFRKYLKKLYTGYSFSDIQTMVGRHIAMYREVASDMFMCGIFELSEFGYLHLVAANFRMDTQNENVKYNAKRCKLVCESIWLQKHIDAGELNVSEMLRDILKAFIRRMAKDLKKIEDANEDMKNMLAGAERKYEEIEPIIQWLVKHIKLSDSLNETKLRVYTKMYRFLIMLQIMWNNADNANEVEIVKDFVSEESFFAETNARNIRQQLFEGNMDLCCRIRDKWNNSFIEQETNCKDGQQEYTAFLMKCYEMCRLDVMREENNVDDK